MAKTINLTSHFSFHLLFPNKLPITLFSSLLSSNRLLLFRLITMYFAIKIPASDYTFCKQHCNYFIYKREDCDIVRITLEYVDTFRRLKSN